VSRGNGAAVFDVLNRGRKNIIHQFNRASQVPDPTNEADFGDGLLMRQGYTLVWVGWQFDSASQRAHGAEQGQPVTGRLSTSFTPNTADPTYPLNEMGRYADTTHYPPVDPASPEAVISQDTSMKVSYEAKGAVVAGLAFAALRDKAWNTSRPGRSRPNMLLWPFSGWPLAAAISL